MNAPVATLSLLAVFFTGCINSTTTLTVQKSGAGTLEERSLANAAFVQMLNQLSQSFGKALGNEASAASSSNPIMQDDEAYRAKAGAFGDGVTFVSAEEIKEADGSLGVLVRYRFDDVRKVQVKLSDTMSAMDNLKSSMPVQMPGTPELPGTGDDADPITFAFDPGRVASLEIVLPTPDEEKMREAAGKAAGAKTPNPSELAQARQFLGDMGFALLVAVEGEVVSSDASYQEGNTATLFALDFGKILDDPEAFAKLQALGEKKDLDDVKSALQDVDGLKFETRESVAVRFK